MNCLLNNIIHSLMKCVKCYSDSYKYIFLREQCLNISIITVLRIIVFLSVAFLFLFFVFFTFLG